MADTIKKDKPVVIVMVGDALRDAGNNDAAIAMYNKSLEILPEQTGANYGLGVLYFNMAVDLTEQANKLPFEQAAEFEKLKADANTKFTLAVPYFEKVLTLKPKDINTLNALKVIYSRLAMQDKYKAVSATLETIKKEQQQKQ